MNRSYFNALSISSLDSDEQLMNGGASDCGSNITQTEMYQQLSYIEEIASNFFMKRPVLLMRDHGVFAEVESGSVQQFEIRVVNLSPDDVVSVTMTCIPNCMWTEDSFAQEKNKIAGVDFHPLKCSFARQDDPTRSYNINPVLYNGEYCLTVSRAHGFTSGVYILSLSLDSFEDSPRPTRHAQFDDIQTVRIAYSVHTVVRAVPVETDKAVFGEVSINEFDYYRFVVMDLSSVVSIKVRSLQRTEYFSEGIPSDPDLYVTNRHEGLVGTSRDSYVWRSTEVGADRLDIYPDDLHLERAVVGASRVLVIGVTGSRENNSYELTVSVTAPVPVVPLLIPSAPATRRTVDGKVPLMRPADHNTATATSSLSTQLAYYSLPVDPSSRSMLAVVVQPSGAVSVVPESLAGLLEAHGISLEKGRAVYVPESDTNREEVGASCAVNVYVSACTRHPTEDNHTWKASVFSSSGVPASVAFVIDADEWKYFADVCYFSVSAVQSGHTPDPHWPSSCDYSVSVHCFDETSSMSGGDLPSHRLRYELFYELFGAVDGHALSQKDRAGLNLRSGHSLGDQHMPSLPAPPGQSVPIDELSLTYNEVEFAAFRDALLGGGARDGQIFYDLGCGSGRAVVAAALSGIRFVKCVGVEVLPALASAAAEVVSRLQTTSSPSSGEREARSRGQLGTASADMRQRLAQMKLSLPLLEIRHAHLLDSDWSDGDLVFLSSLCFSDLLLQAAVDQGARLKTGGRLLTTRLPERFDAHFALEKTFSAKMPWGRANVFVLVRIVDTV